MGGKAGLLTYNDITFSPASILGVAGLFVENRPADIRHPALPWENIGGVEMAFYQSTGITFASAVECGAFLVAQGFERSSERFIKLCDLNGETIEASYTLTMGRCFLTMKHRSAATEPAKKWHSRVDASDILNWYLDGNDEFTSGNVIPDGAGLFYVEVRSPNKAPYRLTRADF